jgi:hypothetical protein
MDENTIHRVANSTSKRVHRAICDSGEGETVPAVDGSITAEETIGLINGAIWGIAAFISQSVVIAATSDGITPEEVMGRQLAEQFVHAYRAYRERGGVVVN